MSTIDEIDKKLDVFKLGVDDYITKPFHDEELLARIKVQLKHQTNIALSSIIKYKDIEINIETHIVMCNQRQLDLTRYEFELLKTLMEHSGQVYTKSILFDKVWGYQNTIDDNTLNVHISKI